MQSKCQLLWGYSSFHKVILQFKHWHLGLSPAQRVREDEWRIRRMVPFINSVQVFLPFNFGPVLSSGEEVDRNLCSSTPAPEPVPCEVPCSRDCVLSDWTPWSSCSQTCSSKTIEGKQMRTRSILAYNAGEGEAQPAGGALVYEWHADEDIGSVALRCHSLNVWISHLSACAFVPVSNRLLISADDYFRWSVFSPDTHFLCQIFFFSAFDCSHWLGISVRLCVVSWRVTKHPPVLSGCVCSHCHGRGVDHSDGG